MTIAIAFVRHGHYEQPEGVPSAWLPHPLTPEGEAQARAGARALCDAARERGWSMCSVVDSSPLLRAWQTAEIWREELSVRGQADASVESVFALCERSLGAAANLSVDEIERVIARDPRCEPLAPGWKRRRDFRLPLPGAESLAQAGGRVARHVGERARALEPSSSAAATLVKLVVGHGGSIRNAAADLGILELHDVAQLSMYYGEAIVYSRGTDGWTHLYGRWKPRAAAVDID